uniref:Uncharacterized protein n=1 Tax=Zooxanthella nutricula TaxID=1333877 RepID=A0A7S2LKH3_9DINO
MAHAESTDPAHALSWCCDDYRPRSLQQFHLVLWLALQLVGLLCQASLLSEISANLAAFEATLAEHCASARLGRGGFCLGPRWNVSLSSVLHFSPVRGQDKDDFDVVLPEAQAFGPFRVASVPPTFLLGVEPLPPNAGARWRAQVVPGQWSPPPLPPMEREGEYFHVVKGTRSMSGVPWSGSVSVLAGTSGEAQVRVTAVDPHIEHLEEIHQQRQCSFEQSWENFSFRHNGQHHMVLARTQFAMRLFLAASCIVVAVMLSRATCSMGGTNGALLRRVIVLKCLAQDFPQQICIVAYMYGWYATNGLRCQMCLFHPLHCGQESPLHWTNLLACAATALSAASSQLLIKAKAKTARPAWDDGHDEDCVAGVFRFALVCLSVLPFLTAIYLSPMWFHYDHIVLVMFVTALPCVSGWLMLCCGWLLVVFKDGFDESL